MLFSAKIGLIYVYIIDASLNHFQGEFQGLHFFYLPSSPEREILFLRGLDMPS